MCTYYHRLILSNFNLFFFLWEWLHECLSKWNKPWYNCRWIISVVMVIIFDTTLTWNVRSMNQGKLEVVKQEMARVNADILGISELKWTGMDDFNSDDHYIYYCRQESLRRNGVAIIVNKRVWNAVLGCILKNDRMISVRFQGKPFNTIVIQVYASTSNAEEAEVEWFYEDLKTF